MDPRFSGVSGSSSQILPISRNPLCTLQNPYINGVELHDRLINEHRVEDRPVNNFGEYDYCSTSTSSLPGWEDYPRFGDVLGSFTGIPYRNNTRSTFQNPNVYGSALQVDYDLLNQQIAEDRSVKHKFGVTHFLSIDPSAHYNSTPSLGDTVPDPTFSPILGPLNDMKFRMVPLYTNPNPIMNALPLPDSRLAYENRDEGRNGKHNLGDHYFLSSEPPGLNTSTSNVVVVEDDHSDDIDFSDAILKYINQILMEEDMEDKVYMLQESLELQAKEQSLYDALGKTEPKPSYHCHDLESANESLAVSRCSMVHATGSNGSYIGWINGSDDYDAAASIVRHPPNSIPEGFFGSNVAPLPTPDESKSVWNFRKGVEEASKFLPAGNKLFNFSANAILLPEEEAEEMNEVVPQMENKEGGDSSSTLLRGRKNPYNGDVDLEEERSIKQAAIYLEPILRSEQFDIVLLHSMGEGAAALQAYRETLQAEKSKILQQNRQQNGSSGRKGRGKRQNGKKKEVVDLRTLLVRCAQAAAADDRRGASELLKMIRQHSSPFGDGNQRLAHCFADGLEARLAGTGSQIYKALVNKRTLAVDFLKAYHLYLASCPFRKISIFAANKTILIRAKKAMRVHIIDFGILYGFQWPTLIQHFAGREGGPPKLKITGIEFPQSGFRPAEQVEETGRRLAEYANMFGVPFEYNAVAKRWDTIKPEDIKIEDGELVAVNCLYRLKNILDETASLESPRTIVLKTIKEINPDIFVHGVVNGAYNAPFFVTRFREALFHFSSLFDKLEATVPREIPERILIEKEIFGREALNVIACEGWERVERPETYKQWQVRNLKAGFTQIPFDRNIMATAVRKVSHYHKDFVIDEDGKWMLLGWKGRTIYGMSCWQHS